MKRETSQKTFKELSLLKDWNFTIIDFIKLKNKNSFQADMYYQAINVAFNKTSLNGMRMLYRDINEMAKGIPIVDLNELNQILRERFDSDLTMEKSLAKIKRIIKRGILKTDDEFRLLLNRVEEIYADDNMKDEVEILNKLMRDYETNKKERLLKHHT